VEGPGREVAELKRETASFAVVLVAQREDHGVGLALTLALVVEDVVELLADVPDRVVVGLSQRFDNEVAEDDVQIAQLLLPQ